MKLSCCCCYKVKEGAAIYLGIVREIGTVVPPKFSCTLTFVVSEQDFHLAKLVGVLLPALELRATADHSSILRSTTTNDIFYSEM